MTIIQAIFPDGAIYTAATYKDLELELRKDVWNPSHRRPFRNAMSKRAMVWSGAEVPTDQRSRGFLEGLEAAEMLRLERS